MDGQQTADVIIPIVNRAADPKRHGGAYPGNSFRCRKLKSSRRRKNRTRKISSIRHPLDQSQLLSFFGSVLFVSLSIAVGCPLMIALSIIVTIVSSVRYVVSVCVLCWTRGCDDRHQHLSPQELFWFEDLSCVVHTVLILDKRMNWQQLKRILLNRVLDARLPHDDNVLRYPRFSQKVVTSASRRFWCHDDHFDVNNHVFKSPHPIRTDEDISDFLNSRVKQTLNFHRPLWEAFISNEYGEDCDRTVIILRTHSCIADGISLIKLLTNSLADCCSGFRMKPRFGGTSYPINVLRALIVGPLTVLLWLLFGSKDRNPFRTTEQQMSGQRTMLFSKNVSLSKIKRIKQVTRCRYNDVLLSLVTGSLRNYSIIRGVKSPESLTANIPVDLRFESPSSTRRIQPDVSLRMSVVNIKLPTNVEGAIPRLWQIHRSMEELKNSADTAVMYGALYYLYGLLPKSIASWIFRTIYSRQSVQFTNLPGPEINLYIESHRLSSVMFWAPSIVSRVPISISLLTYGDSVKMTLSADTGAVPDARSIIDEFVKLVETVSRLLEHRRIPGEHRRRSYSSVAHNEETLAKVPPIEDLQQRLREVQEELQEITNKLELSSPDGTVFRELTSTQRELAHRMQELKEQFSVVLEELRRRKSLADGVIIFDEDEIVDAELRKPRKRALSTPTVWKTAVMTSTARPLTTPTLLSSNSPGMNSPQRRDSDCFDAARTSLV
ncbi:Uncharacterised protein g1139 [Pycnogonum litorale]